jgi:hypothetical protein
MIRTLSSVLALAAFSAASCAQGTWPDDPWTDYRSINGASVAAEGRAVAFAGTTIVSSGLAPGKPYIGAFATYARGERRYEVLQYFEDPARALSGGFGMRIAAHAGIIAVADPGYDYIVYEHVTLSSFPPLPDRPGRVEIYTRPSFSSEFAHAHTLENPTGNDASGFGLSLSLAGDYLLVGAPLATVFGVPEAGAAFLYEKRFNQTTFTRIATFLPPSPEPYSHFGWSVAASRSHGVFGVFIGWPNFDNGEGRVAYFTEAPAAPWKLTRVFSPADLNLSNNIDVRQFGASVATMPDNGQILAIGAPDTSDFPGLLPTVFVYEADFIDGEPFEFTSMIVRPDTLAGARFGDALAFNTDSFFRLLAVGSGNRDIGGGIINLYSSTYGDDDWEHTAQLRNVNGGSLAVFPYQSEQRVLASGNDRARGTLYSREAMCFPDLRGDANGDGVTNFEDLNLVLTDFGLEGENIPGDINNDGVVDFVDLNVVLVLYGSPCIPPN